MQRLPPLWDEMSKKWFAENQATQFVPSMLNWIIWVSPHLPAQAVSSPSTLSKTGNAEKQREAALVCSYTFTFLYFQVEILSDHEETRGKDFKFKLEYTSEKSSYVSLP